MTLHRLSVAVLCATFLWGATFGTMPSCHRGMTASRLACCRNEATCPMHQRHASGPFGWNACHGDGVDFSSVVTQHRAVLATTVSTGAVLHGDRTFENTTTMLPSASLVPPTPPPRIG